MGVSLSVMFDKPVGRSRTPDEFNALGNGLEGLDKVLTKAGVPTLGRFVSLDPDDCQDMDPDDPAALGMPPLAFFRPKDGRAAVRAVAGYLRQNPKKVPYSADLLAELELVEKLLAEAEKKGAKFYLAYCD